MAFRLSGGGLNRQVHQSGLQLPEYPLPSDLEAVLDINDESPLSRKSKMYSNILQSLDPVKYVDLSECHYVQLLKFALYLEEYQSNEEMKKRKMTNQTVKKLTVKDPHEILFAIHVKELDDERAWIHEGDFVDVTDPRNDQTYTLRVAKVEQSDVVASDEGGKFSDVFGPKNLYNISFRFQNYPLKCAHYALWLAYKENVITYLFPQKSKSFIEMGSASYEPLTILNPNIETNPEQKQAVQNILNKSSFPAPYILYGPPGTGKTATLIEAICQIQQASSSNRILVCTPSNTAADEVAKRLLKFLDASDIYRIYSQSKDKSSVDKELQNCCFCGGDAGSKFSLRREDIAGKAVLISTLCTATRFVLMKANGTLSADYFSHIIIDEAGQGTEPDILIPISFASLDGKLHSQIVLAGDPQQLGPTVVSKLADIILGRSILERLMSYDTYSKDYYNNYDSKYITKLLHNYRSHPSIIHISNKLFYDNELVAKFSSEDHKVKFPVIFHGVEGIEEKYSYSPSTYNYEEIRTVLKYVYDLIDEKTEFGKVSAKDIGIVTPFKLQSKRIKQLLKKKDKEERRKPKEEGSTYYIRASTGERVNVILPKSTTTKNEISDDDSDDEKSVLENEDEDNDDDQSKLRRFKDINVGTVELFQGQERKIMIMTAVRSKTFLNDGKEHIGFLSNPKRFNVAMTRAQNALIVIGNPGILQKDVMWHYLLKYCTENGSYRGSKFALKTSGDGKPIQSGLEKVVSTASLFKEKPFKLFQLDSLDSTEDIAKTVDVFVEPDKKKLEERRLAESFSDLKLIAYPDYYDCYDLDQFEYEPM